MQKGKFETKIRKYRIGDIESLNVCGYTPIQKEAMKTVRKNLTIVIFVKTEEENANKPPKNGTNLSM